MKATHIAIFKDKEGIMNEIIVTSQSKTRHFPTKLFHYMHRDGIGNNPTALRYLKMVDRKNGKWQRMINTAVNSYWRSN